MSLEAASNTVSPSNPRGLLRTPLFDGMMIVGVAGLALISGFVVWLEPSLFPLVLFLDLWLLGYHHVVSTFTRLAFDKQSMREHRALLTWLPIVVVAAVLITGLTFGGWILATTYLYWQWFHYTRQSYGIERAYRRKTKGAIAGDERLTRWALYLLPLWGILYRSHQAPEYFLGMELRVLPVSRVVVDASAVLAIAVLGAWVVQAGLAWIRGAKLQAHTLYVLLHFVIFSFGYLILSDLDHGWLVVNVWHNAQYILFVWMFNNSRFRDGVQPQARFLSYLSQQRNWLIYAVVCLGISSALYFGLDRGVQAVAAASTLPIFLICYQAINFHHYVVDGLIWKMRRKPLRTTLQLDSS